MKQAIQIYKNHDREIKKLFVDIFCLGNMVYLSRFFFTAIMKLFFFFLNVKNIRIVQLKN